jgi:serralysin
MVKGFFTPGSVTSNVGSSATTTKYLTGDFNKDGIPDLIQISGSIGSLKYNAKTSINNGSGSFSLSLVPRVVGNYETTTQYLSADVNNDGFTDLIEIWKNGTTNKFQSATWVNNGLGSFNIGPENTNIGNFAVNTKYLNADVNKDGFADLIQISQNTATNKYTATTWNNNGLGSFNVGFVTSPIGNYEATTQYLTGDFNNDGFADLIEIWRNGSTSKYTATAWLNDNQGSFYLGPETSSIGNYATTTQYLSADVDNDGFTDLIEIWQNGTTNKFQSTTWLNNKQGSFYLGTTTNDVGNYAADTKYLSSDVNQDGSPDLIQIFQNGTKFSAATWINSEDSTPNITLAVSPSSVAEDGLANLVYTFTRTGATTDALSVNYSIAGTATGNDYTNAAPTAGTTITFAAGASTTTLIIDPTADTLVENNETVALTLLTGTGYSVGTTTAVTGTILNDDFATPTPNITLAVSPSSVAEDGLANLVYTFTRTGATTNALSVNYSIAGTALGNDYTNAAPTAGTTITFAAGASTTTLIIDPTADTLVESDETVALTLLTGTGYSVGTTTAVIGTIINDDTRVTLAVSPSSVTEDGTANLVYTFNRTGVTTNALSVNYSIAGTANGSDYTNAAPTIGTTITFAAGASTTTLIIDPTADTLVEGNETVALKLLTGTGYSVGTTTAVTGTILNDDLTASTTTTLPTNFTTLTLTGTSNIDGTGNASDNVITGNSGNNILDGSDGNDTYLFALTTTAGLGSDTIKDASGIDTISFAGTAAGSKIQLNLSIPFTQTVSPGTRITLDSGNAIENAIGGLGDDRLIGNTLNNYLEGDLGNDLLSGGFGDDILFGGLGNNTLTGGDGNDILISGLGTDNLFGGVGNDQFLYTGSAAFNSTVNGVATIADFSTGSDQLVLSKTLFASLTSDIGTGFSNSSEFDYVQDDALAGSSSAKIVYSLSSGSLFYNEDGAATAGFGTGGEFAILDPLAATDFQIIV